MFKKAYFICCACFSSKYSVFFPEHFEKKALGKKKFQHFLEKQFFSKTFEKKNFEKKFQNVLGNFFFSKCFGKKNFKMFWGKKKSLNFYWRSFFFQNFFSKKLSKYFFSKFFGKTFLKKKIQIYFISIYFIYFEKMFFPKHFQNVLGEKQIHNVLEFFFQNVLKKNFSKTF